MKILYLSCHSTLEFDELKLFTEMGHECFSYQGAYAFPEGHPSLKRPGVPNMLPHKELAIESLKYAKTKIPKDFFDWADVVIVMHDPNVIGENWDRMKHKKVVWRTIGQSTQHVENMIRRMRYEGMKIVRMSRMEENIIGYVGSDSLIPFYKDPWEWLDWNGKTKRVINFTQSLLGRRSGCHYDTIMQIIQDFPALIYGSGNTDLGSLDGGELPYELMRGALRDNRLFVYAGTWPSPYTLALQEAMMCFPPETLVDSDTKIQDVLEKDYEGDLITIETEEGKVSCTPNHPFLTNRGFTRADNLCIMDRVYIRLPSNNEKQQMDNRRIGDIVKEFSITSKRTRETTSEKNSLCDSHNNEEVEVNKIKLKHFQANEIFFNSLRDMLLGWDSRWRGNFNLQEEQAQNKSFVTNIFHSDGSYQLAKRKVPRYKEPRSTDKEYRETKNSLYLLVKGISNIATPRSITTLSLDEKRALWNFEFFYKEPSEKNVQGYLFRKRKRILEADKTIKSSRIIKISRQPYKGKVYNLSTADGVYWAENFLVHNTGIPIISIGSKLANDVVPEPDRWNYFEIPDIIKNGENGFVSDNINELRQDVDLLLKDEGLAKKIGDKGRETAIKLWSKEKAKEDWKRFFETL